MTAERAGMRAVASEILHVVFEDAPGVRELCEALAMLGAQLHRRCSLDFTEPLPELPDLSELVARAAVCCESAAVSLLVRGAEPGELIDLTGGLVGWALESLTDIDETDGRHAGDLVLRDVCARLAV